MEGRNSRVTVDWHVSFEGEWWEAKAGFLAVDFLCRFFFFVFIVASLSGRINSY